MERIILKAPAKINFTLDVKGKREDGYHDIRSIMHTISLYDYITVDVEKEHNCKEIIINGNSDEIPYDERNLAWKAANAFLEKANICQAKVAVYIDKKIPVAAGLAGGSTDAAAVLKGLNEVYENILSEQQIHEICSKLGSDLNFCFRGGCAICSSRGEKIQSIPYLELPISVVKPKNFGISAKEAYEEFDKQDKLTESSSTEKLLYLILRGDFDSSLISNDLEKPLCNKYNYLKNIKRFLKNSNMTGSGPTFFVVDKKLDVIFEPDEFTVHENLETAPGGIEVIARQ